MRRLVFTRTISGNTGAIAAVMLVVMFLSGAAVAERIGCSAAANAANLACDFAAKDDLFAARAICMDSPDEDLLACFEGAMQEFDEVLDECGEIFEAQLEVCELTEDAAHVPEFGGDFAENFVDPLLIGVSVAPNPWFPLIQGNEWVYEG
ncbi:MAG: hypothetical protein OEQ90_08245, partial [Gammaproteobacteria bacterium]|nr:hypothetical protein [Gammaproteobacteria bacterium]